MGAALFATQPFQGIAVGTLMLTTIIQLELFVAYYVGIVMSHLDVMKTIKIFSYYSKIICLNMTPS